MQITLSFDDIQALASNQRAYQLGKSLLERGSVSPLFFLPKQQVSVAYVLENSYQSPEYVQIEWNQRGKAKRISCSCAESKTLSACCHHMTAVLLASMNQNAETMPLWTKEVHDLYLKKQNRPANAIAVSPSRTAVNPPSTELAYGGFSPTSSLTSAVPRTGERTIHREGGNRLQLEDPIQMAEQQCSSLLSRLRATRLLPPLNPPTSVEEEEREELDQKLGLGIRLQLPRMTSELALLNLVIYRHGSRQTYQVRQLEDFLCALLNGKDYFFGRSLHVFPMYDQFDPESKQLLQFLTHHWHRALTRQSFEHLAKQTAYGKEGLTLSPEQLASFLEHFAPKAEALDFHFRRQASEAYRPLQVCYGFPPLVFHWQLHPQHEELFDLHLREQDEEARSRVPVYCPSCKAKSEKEPGLRLLTRDAQWLFYNDLVYRLEGEDALLYTSLVQALAADLKHRLAIPRSFAHRFLSLLHPTFHDTGLFFLHSEGLDHASPQGLKTYLWLDPTTKGLRLSLRFFYGQYGLNPHPLQGEQWVQYETKPQTEEANWLSTLTPCDSPSLIRELSAEEEILSLLNEIGFSPQAPISLRQKQAEIGEDFAYYLQGDERLFNFFKFYLATFQTCCEAVYLNQQLQKSMVQRLQIKSGAFRLESQEQYFELQLEDWPYSMEDTKEVLKAYREKKRYARLKDGRFVELLLKQHARALQLLDSAYEWAQSQDSDHLYLPKYRAVSLLSLAQGEASHYLQASSEVSQLYHELIEPSALHCPIPSGLDATMRPYQQLGFQWLARLDYYGLGGILADDMGLGKTLQALALIEHKRTTTTASSGLALVVAPTSLIYNWEQESARFLPQLRCLVLEGTKKQRGELLNQLEEVDLLICSYAILRQEKASLEKVKFSTIFLDEAQAIKNPLTQTAKAVKSLSAQRRFALTGTPIENRLSELWSIMDFLMPGYLYSHRYFMKHYEQPILRQQSRHATEQLQRLVSPFVLRRLKKDVLKELPDKIETVLECELRPEQAKVYYAYLQEARAEVKATENDNAGQRRIALLALLTRLRQICAEPSLFLDGYDGGSGKLDTAIDLLQNLTESGHRCLVFSPLTTSLQRLQKEVEALGLRSYYLDGDVSAKTRLELVDRFNAGHRQLFFISLKAGGTGLNLTGADCVLHLDPWWNPAVEDQASDRAHRLGQTRGVQVFRLVTRHTIEQKILDLQTRKRGLIENLLVQGESVLDQLTLDDLQALFED